MRNVPEPAFHAFMRVEHRTWDGLARYERLKKALWIDVGDDRARSNRRAVVKHDAAGAAVLHDHFAHRGAHIDAHAVLAGRARHRLRDRAHAADGVTPHAVIAVHFAERVMQQHIGGARRVGARQVAHDRVEAEHRLDRIGFEPLIERVAGRFAEQIERRLEAVRPPQPLADRGELAQFAQGAGEISQEQVGRRFEHKAAQHGGDAADLSLIGRITGGILALNFAISRSVRPSPVSR